MEETESKKDTRRGASCASSGAWGSRDGGKSLPRARPHDRNGPQSTLLENLVNKTQLAKHFGVSVGFINKYMPLGLPYLKLGRAVRFRVSEVVIWLKKEQNHD